MGDPCEKKDHERYADKEDMQTADQAGKKPGNGYTDIVIPPIDSMESQLKPYVLPQRLRHHQLSKAERVKIYMKLGCNCQCRARERDGNQKKLRVGGPCDKTKAAFEMAMDLLKSKGTNTSASESSDNSESAPPPKKNQQRWLWQKLQWWRAI